MGASNRFKGLAAGSRRFGGWFYVKSNHAGDVQQVVVCESAIDTLSYAVLHPTRHKTLYVSTDGAGNAPGEQLRQIPR
nr:toprim domain-containing protein [Myxacorys almedinensis]